MLITNKLSTFLNTIIYSQCKECYNLIKKQNWAEKYDKLR